MSNAEQFDLDYYENGVITGKSGYVNYQWMPELTIKLAYNIIKHLNIKENEKVLDYGCAKGYLVKALRLLDVNACGVDISDYAIKLSDAEVRDYCRLVSESDPLPSAECYDWLITKDVLEHMPESTLDNFLEKSRLVAKKAFHVVPLGDSNDKYIVSEYENDVTHVLAKSQDWWQKKFESHGWVVESFSYKVRGIKESWTNRYEYGNGFFILK